MRVGEYCTKEVAIANRDTGIGAAAALMRAEHVGDLVVVEDGDGTTRPVGIVTDRDLVVEILATGIEPDSVTIADLPSRDLAVARENDDLMDTVQRMRSLGVRRMPVVDTQGALVGILAVDDVLGVLAELSAHLVKLTAREVAAEVRTRP